ncbi:MAG: sulfite exporter TauE/SafE family protein [Acidobacteria bacterium]|nr:sulfite exporter TauE/SafE family protein [Acidobacteriota bacterium]
MRASAAPWRCTSGKPSSSASCRSSWCCSRCFRSSTSRRQRERGLPGPGSDSSPDSWSWGSTAASSRPGSGSWNAIKVASIFLFSLVSLSVFAANGVVDWGVGLALGIGTFAGALVGARLTLRAGDRILRFVVAAATLAFAVALWLRT